MLRAVDDFLKQFKRPVDLILGGLVPERKPERTVGFLQAYVVDFAAYHVV